MPCPSNDPTNVELGHLSWIFSVVADQSIEMNARLTSSDWLAAVAGMVGDTGLFREEEDNEWYCTRDKLV